MDDIAAAQAQLGRSLEQAQQGVDQAMAGLIRDEGHALVMLLAGLLRLTRMHALHNRAFDKPVSEFERVLGKLNRVLGAIHVVIVEDQVYLNDIRIRLSGVAEGVAEALSVILGRHGVGGVSFHDVLTDLQIRAFVAAIAADPADQAPLRALNAQLSDAGLTAVQVLGSFRFKVKGEQGGADAAEVDQSEVSEHSRGAIAEAWTNLEKARMPNPLPVRRAVTELLEAGLDGNALLNQDSAMNRHGAHVVRVARVSLLIGEALGLSSGALQDLGVAALFHDIGYAGREGATSEHPGFAPPFSRHATAGARLLMRQRGFHESKVRRMLGVLEHHLDYDDPVRPSLFGRILRVAEDYDNLSDSAACSWCPALALQQIQAGAGTRYDPVVVQALINRLGRYPPGCLLRLSDGRLARSTGLARDAATFALPQAEIFQDFDGELFKPPIAVDLAVHSAHVVELVHA